MQKIYKKIIFIFCAIVLITIIGGVVRYSLEYIDKNPEKYFPKTNQKIFWSINLKKNI